MQQHVSKSKLDDIDSEMFGEVLKLFGANSMQGMTVECSLTDLETPDEQCPCEVPVEQTPGCKDKRGRSVICSLDQVDRDIVAPVLIIATPLLEEESVQNSGVVLAETTSQQQGSKDSRLSQSVGEIYASVSLVL